MSIRAKETTDISSATSANPGFTRITGYTEEDIIGKTSIEYNIWGNIEDRQKLVAGLRKDGDGITS